MLYLVVNMAPDEQVTGAFFLEFLFKSVSVSWAILPGS